MKNDKCGDPDCIVCEPDVPAAEPIPFEHEWVRWDDANEVTCHSRIRTTVRAERPNDHQATPLIYLAEDAVEVGPHRSSPRVTERDLVILSRADAEWVIEALQKALAFTEPAAVQPDVPRA